MSVGVTFDILRLALITCYNEFNYMVMLICGKVFRNAYLPYNEDLLYSLLFCSCSKGQHHKK